MTVAGSSPLDPPGDLVTCKNVTKSFGGVAALRDASLSVAPGEVVALVGENGAGKSTLMRVIAGEITQDSGTVTLNAVVGLVRQQLSTVPGLNVLEHIALVSPMRGRIRWSDLAVEVRELMDQTGLQAPLTAQADKLPVSLQQRVEIISVLHRGARCLLLDEPTTYLTPHEVDGLFNVLRGLTDTGVSAVFISHKLREVTTYCDRIGVLSHGTSVAHFARPPFDQAEVGRAMTMRTSRVEPLGRETPGVGDPPIDVGGLKPDLRGTPSRKLSPAAVAQGSDRACTLRAGALAVRETEIIGIAGVAGNGQDELVAALSGLKGSAAYSPVILGGQDVTNQSTWRRRQHGLRLIPSNVRGAGVATKADLVDNLMTARVPPQFTSRRGWVKRDTAAAATRLNLRHYDVRAIGPSQGAGELSGGNLQKFVVGRELEGSVKVLVAHEPTRGVDFTAADQIRQRIRQFADEGGSVVLLTSDLDELLEISDRVHVLFDGKLSDAREASALSLATLGELMGGVGTSTNRDVGGSAP